MSEPTGDQQSGSGRSSRNAPKVDVLTVGNFERVDPITGGTDAGIGVVVQVGDVLYVAPVAAHLVQVDPADFAPLSADDI
jgi:hypothetical protein